MAKFNFGCIYTPAVSAEISLLNLLNSLVQSVPPVRVNRCVELWGAL